MNCFSTFRQRLAVVGGSLLLIVCLKASVEVWNHRNYLADSENKQHLPDVRRVAYQPGSKSEAKSYYPHIPELQNLKLSRDVLKAGEVNRDIKAIATDPDALWTRRLLMTSAPLGTETFETNRLLYKLHDSVVHNTSTDCVIRVFEMCRKGCWDAMKDETRFEWTRSRCKFSNCRIESKVGKDLADFHRSDVVIFHIDDRDWEPFIKTRPPGQLWVFHSKEAPIHGPNATPPREFGNPFNISISYLLEADIAPAYYFLDTEQPEKNPKVLRKKKLMSWVASNCYDTSWNRTQFVQELQNSLNIDTYGACGRLECPRSEIECWEMRAQYKFYLALENSQCPEYITEKFWHNSLAVGTVPIVFGAPKADYERLAPPQSFIHLDDFSTVEELVKYINFLDHNDEKYLEYFSWRRLGRVMKGSPILTNRVQGPGKVLCFTIKTLLLKSLFPEDYPWQDNHPVFYDWWYGMCSADSQKRRIMDIDV